MFPMSRKKSFVENLKDILIYTFPADGHDPITRRLNSETYSLEHLSQDDIDEKLQVRTLDEDQVEAFIRDPLTIYTSVLGLPNRAEENKYVDPVTGQQVTTFKQSGWNLLRRFTGYSKDSSLFAKLISVPFFTLLNLAATPFRFLTRVVTLFTEVLPAIMLMLARKKAFSPLWKETKLAYDDGNYLNMMGFGLLTAAVLPFLGASYMVWFYGRCATSPVQAVREAWYSGNKVYGFIGGVVLSLFTITNILALYAVLAPLTVKFLSLQVLPWVATHAPAGAAGLLKPIFTTLGPIFNALGKAGLALASHFSLLCNIPGVTAIMAVMPEMVGIGFLAGILTSTVGPILGYLENVFVEHFWYRKPFDSARDEVGDEVGDEDDELGSEHVVQDDHDYTTSPSPSEQLPTLKSKAGDDFHPQLFSVPHTGSSSRSSSSVITSSDYDVDSRSDDEFAFN